MNEEPKVRIIKSKADLDEIELFQVEKILDNLAERLESGDLPLEMFCRTVAEEALKVIDGNVKIDEPRKLIESFLPSDEAQ